MKGGGQTVTQTPSAPASTYLNSVLAQKGQPDYTAVKGATDAANAQQWNDFYNNVVPQLNHRATFLGNPTGAIKDLNSSITNLQNNQNWNAQQAYLGQYDQAQNRALEAANLDGRTSTTTNQPGSGATLADILGGGLGLAGLYNILKGGNAGGAGGSGLGKDLVSGGKYLYNKLTGGDPSSLWGGPSANDLSGITMPALAQDPSALAQVPGIDSMIGDATPDFGLGGADASQIASAAQSTGAVPGLGSTSSSIPGELAGWSASAAAPAAAAAMPALTAADIAGSAGIGGDAAIEAALQGYADTGIAGLGGAAGADAAAGGAASAGLGSSALAALPVAAGALALASPFYGMLQPTVEKNDAYYTRLNNYIKAGPGAYAASKGFNGSYIDPQYTNYMMALQALHGSSPDMTGYGKVGGGPISGILAGRK